MVAIAVTSRRNKTCTQKSQWSKRLLKWPRISYTLHSGHAYASQIDIQSMAKRGDVVYFDAAAKPNNEKAHTSLNGEIFGPHELVGHY